MDQVGKWPRSAAVFGASGGIGRAVGEVLAEGGCEIVHVGSRSGNVPEGPAFRPFTFDLTNESSIADAASAMKKAPPECVFVASGILTLSDGTGPERTYKRLDAAAMAQVFAINTTGPAIVAKHMLALMPREKRFVFAALSARVGSISDNGLGGWHSYRASKAALNMLLRNFALETKRTHKEGVVVGLHPGTVDTKLSERFQSNLPEGQLTTPQDAARMLVDVMRSLGPDDSGKVFDFAGKAIPA
ncbi:C-factor [Erythrobacter sp. KY5]|uniref:SDR family NAD(P)-dependent oxidoreductase n=1 Tax=Erythrobacter sp. KY5 TaxID=2011159 RepID=UPI000DBF1A1A|nr:SDR family NAD(P)-dependent oxidoreductase [Erythrobacter sp. KY5]AWW74887.1 C-factor [Erythrobacter sp. KY5]